MICGYCQKESSPQSRICPYCGRYMGDEPPPVATGDAVPMYDDSDYRPKPKPGKTDARRRKTARRRKRSGRADAKRRRRENYRRPMVNWAMVWLMIGILAFVGAVGSYVYLKVTPSGQLMLARLGRDASPDAYWALGGEYLDQGYIAKSVATYEKALAMQPDHPKLVEKLMLLAEAYETASRQKDAEAVYTRIYREIAPKDPIGYRNVIRLILQDPERLPEAVDIMQLAFEKTEDSGFAKQRASYVPLPPKASVPSGRHLISQTVEFISPQGYDIYYLTGPGQLPEDGTLYTGPITMGEGSYSFRAVCVSSNLVSDVMDVKYVVSLPTPPAPKSNLQPGTYKGYRSFRLRDMTEDKKEPNTLYYTLDGTAPSPEDSPRYTGEPIRLAAGTTEVRAIAVNKYGKTSNEMIVQYKITGVPRFKNYLNKDDEFSQFKLMKTDFEAFTALYGQPENVKEIEDSDVGGQCYAAAYPWGEARFVASDIGRLVYYVRTTDAGMAGPRGVKVGMDLADITPLFRDMGQPANDRGDRGLYYNIDYGYGNYKVDSDDPATGSLTYVATLFNETPYSRLFIVDIRAGKAAQMTFSHVARKVSLIH